MPCDGPSQEFAYARGEKVYNELAILLCKQYGLMRPEDVSPGTHPMYKKTFKAQERVKKAIQELFWKDACETF